MDHLEHEHGFFDKFPHIEQPLLKPTLSGLYNSQCLHLRIWAAVQG
jgi:hypothetical protein